MVLSLTEHEGFIFAATSLYLQVNIRHIPSSAVVGEHSESILVSHSARYYVRPQTQSRIIQNLA